MSSSPSSSVPVPVPVPLSLAPFEFSLNSLELHQTQTQHNSKYSNSHSDSMNPDNESADNPVHDTVTAAGAGADAAPYSYLRTLLLGQLLSLLLTGTGVFSQLLANSSVNIPTSQSFLNYLFLSCLFPVLYCRWHQRCKEFHSEWQKIPDAINAETAEAITVMDSNSISDSASASSSSSVSVSASASSSSVSPPSLISISWWKYFLISLLDVEGNYCLVSAYQFTSITSVQLLDCFTIPVVMFLSYRLLSVRYNLKHYSGVFLSFVGLVVLIVSDERNSADSNSSDSASSNSNRLLGDFLVLLGCVFYAISNVSQEYIVKEYNSLEFLSMLGVFGSAISFVQMILLERTQLMELDWGDSILLLYLLGFSFCLLSLYLLAPVLLHRSSAIFLNLSLLTSDFWSLMAAKFLFRSHLIALYFIAFGSIVIGVIVYHTAGEKQMWERIEKKLQSCWARDKQTKEENNPFIKDNASEAEAEAE